MRFIEINNKEDLIKVKEDYIKSKNNGVEYYTHQFKIGEFYFALSRGFGKTEKERLEPNIRAYTTFGDFFEDNIDLESFFKNIEILLTNSFKDIIIYVDMDGVLADFATKQKLMIEKEPLIQYPQCQYGFFHSLDTIEDSIDAYNLLKEIFTLEILTAPSVPNPLCYTEKRVWVENKLGYEEAEKMHISGSKNRFIGDYLIDDNKEGKGQDKFTGELIHFNQSNKNWKYVVNYLLKKHIVALFY